jgi:Bax protein
MKQTKFLSVLLISFSIFTACGETNINYDSSARGEATVVVDRKTSLSEYQKLQKWDPLFFGQLPKVKYDQLQRITEEILFGDAEMKKHCEGVSLKQLLKNTDIPKFLAKKTPYKLLSKYHKTDIKQKKITFLCHIIPAAIVANHKTISERAKLYKLIQDFEKNKDELENYAVGYGIKAELVKQIMEDKETYEIELSKRVLPIPMSLILAQASEESGWGMGRLANACTNYFSLYAYGTEVVPPDCIPKGAPNRKLKKYESILDNTEAYLMRLNGSINYYNDFREARYKMISSGKFDGSLLTGNLKEYAENPHYKEDLNRHIRINKLKKWDQLFSFDNKVLKAVNKAMP